MHELSIAHSLIELLVERLADEEPVRVRTVRVRVGELSGVDPVALMSAFPVAAQGTPIDGARLVIEPVPVRILCPSCQREQPAQDARRLRCAVCDALGSDVLAGRELDVTSMEVDDGDDDHATDAANPGRPAARAEAE